jgi:SagB-type dehydrogenase family enzyme
VASSKDNVSLPKPSLTGPNSLEQLLAQRRSVRSYQDTPVELADIGQLLWATQGITHGQGYRTAPSAGALYPLELYVVAGNIEGLEDGVYHYNAERHDLSRISRGDLREKLALAAYSQQWMKTAAAIIAVAGVHERTTQKYGKRGKRYVLMEAGIAAQNLFLQSESLGLATVVVGAFTDEAVSRLLQLPDDAKPLLLMPVGRKRGEP